MLKFCLTRKLDSMSRLCVRGKIVSEGVVCGAVDDYITPVAGTGFMCTPFVKICFFIQF